MERAMSHSKRIFRAAVSFLFLVVFISFGASPAANASPYSPGTNSGDVSCTGGGYFTVASGVVTGNTGCAGEAIIPDEVTSIGINAFNSNLTLTKVTFGPGSQLTSIDTVAFQGVV
jgi:hypothetical protein